MRTLEHEHPAPQDEGDQGDPGDDDVNRPPILPIAVLLLTTAHRLGLEIMSALRFEYYSVVGLVALQHIRATGPMCPRHLAAALGASRSAATQLVKRLVRDELVECRRDDSNRRERVIRLTDKGDDYGRWANEAGESCMRSCMESFTDDERATLRSLLVRLERNADYHRAMRWFASPGKRLRRGDPRPALHVR